MLVFGKCQIWVWPNRQSCDYPQSAQKNEGKVQWLGHDRLIAVSCQLIIHLLVLKFRRKQLCEIKEKQMRLIETEDMKWFSRHKKFGQHFTVSMANKYSESVVVQYFEIMVKYKLCVRELNIILNSIYFCYYSDRNLP